jgi:hypothetical protein
MPEKYLTGNRRLDYSVERRLEKEVKWLKVFVTLLALVCLLTILSFSILLVSYLQHRKQVYSIVSMVRAAYCVFYDSHLNNTNLAEPSQNSLARLGE